MFKLLIKIMGAFFLNSVLFLLFRLEEARAKIQFWGYLFEFELKWNKREFF